MKIAYFDCFSGASGDMLLGSLIGVIGGPVGMAVGAATGSMAGLMGDAVRTGVNDDFLVEVMETLTPGKYALVAEIAESWTMPLDTRTWSSLTPLILSARRMARMAMQK